MIIKAESLTALLRGASKNVDEAATLYEAGAVANKSAVVELLGKASSQLNEAIPSYNKLFPLPGADASRLALQNATDGVMRLQSAIDKGSKFLFSPVPNMRQISSDIGHFANLVDNKLFQPPPMLNDIAVGLKVGAPGLN